MKSGWFSRLLLLPFSLLYGSIISMRNILYESGLLKSTRFNIPVISVGNLSLGGSGKTPHIEYLIRLLSPYINVATLSRGYKRKSKGFQWVNLSDTARDKGDEPVQYKKKFPDLPVAVSESRNIGIPLMLSDYPGLQAILLDDAFQHRSVVPGLNILLTQFSHPFTDDYLLPAGRLREPRSSYERADIIIVSKCPDHLDQDLREDFISRIKPLSHQEVFFSKYKYPDPYYLFDSSIKLPVANIESVVLISAIASVEYLQSYLEKYMTIVNVVEYEDHHFFTEFEMSRIKLIYDNIEEENTIFLTTEKDATRLELHKDFIIENNIPMFVLPVEVEFFNHDKEDFEKKVKDFLLSFRV